MCLRHLFSPFSNHDSIGRVHRYVPAEDVAKLLAGRFQLINFWRPIENPVLDWPLALCDYRSVNPKNDPFPVSFIYQDREGEVYNVQYNEKNRWIYLHGTTPEEFNLIKCFDTVQDGSVSAFTPHTAFKDPTIPGEMRLLANPLKLELLFSTTRRAPDG